MTKDKRQPAHPRAAFGPAYACARLRSRVATAVVAMAVVWAVLSASALTASAQRYQIHTYSETDGLPSSGVWGVVQRDSGTMWFATRAGVATYDGVRWVTHDLQSYLNARAVHALLRDRQDRVWALGYVPSQGVAMHDGKGWRGSTRLNRPYETMTTAVLHETDAESSVIIATWANTILEWNGAAWTVLWDPEDVDARIECMQIRGSSLLLGMGPRVYSLELDGEGHEPQIVREFGPDNVSGLHLDPESGDLWVMSNQVLYLTHGDELQVERELRGFVFPPNGGPIKATGDGRGGMLLGNQTRLYRFDGKESFEALEPRNGLASGGTTDLFRDREGNLWIATLRGISKLVGLRFAGYDESFGLLGDEVSAILERRNGEMVLGQVFGLTIMGEELSTIHFGGIYNEGRVSDLAEDSRGNLWAAASDLGLARVDPSGTVRWFGIEEGLLPPVRSAICDESDELWVISGAGLGRWNGERFETVLVQGGPATGISQLRRVIDAPGDAVWVTSGWQGLLRYDKGRLDRWSYPENREVNNVYDVLVEEGGDEDDTVWVGTAAGLYLTDPSGALRPVLSNGPTIRRSVYLLFGDPEGVRWIGTDNGVFRWDGEELRHFTSEDGLLGKETNRAAGVVTRDGRVWIGTDQGVSVYREELDIGHREPPLVALESVDVAGERLALDAPLRLHGEAKALSFDFRAISFLDEDRIVFRTWLEGFEDDWSPPQAQPTQSVRYTQLRPGRYRFHVQAANAEGRWSGAITSPLITIPGPFYARPSFIVLALTVAGMLLYGLFSFASHRRYARRLEIEVSERTRALESSERAKALESQRLSTILTNIADGVVAIDHRGAIFLVNPAAETILGAPSSAMLGRPLSEVVGGEAAAQIATSRALIDRFRAAARASRSLQEITTLHTPGAGTKRIEFMASPILEGDRSITRMVVVFRDITERENVERELQQAQRLESLGVMAGGIAHDFNNLLAVILGNLALLERSSELDDEDQRRVSDAIAASLVSRNLSRQLMTFTRGSAPDRKAASLGEAVAESVSFVLSGSNVRADLQLPSQLWASEFDRGQISQVVQNIVLNACQAMPDGGTLRVRGENLEQAPSGLDPGRCVAIEFEDTGSGIPPENMERIFDPYFSTKEKGHGLGLAIAYSIVSKHGGHLGARSAPGRGSTIRMILPAAEELAESRRCAESRRVPRDGFILVMDDEPAVRATTGQLLRSLGCRVEYAADGAEMIDLYRMHRAGPDPFDAVLLDLTVPGGMGGAEAMRRLLEFDPEAVGILASGYSQDSTAEDAHAHGFRARIHKPYSLDELAEVLCDTLGPSPAGQPS